MPYRRMGCITAWIVIFVLTACGAPATQPSSSGGSASSNKELTVFAAASLTQPFNELGKQFEASNPGVKVTFNYNASQQLRGQLELGAYADVFASANVKEMNAAIQASLVVSGTQHIFVHNRLVVVYPKDNPAQITTLADLARPNLKLVIADRPVPAGQYTLEMLGKMSADPSFGPDFQTRVLANVVSREATIEAVANKIEIGEADAGVVYTSNVTRAAADKVRVLDVPDQFNQIASYPIAPLAQAANPELANQWIAFVLSETGQQTLSKYGFIPVQMAKR
jgi:molybdate transport system substrate-binding protein